MDREGYIASMSTWKDGLGTPECPWRIDTEPGKRIRLHLIDFALEGTQSDGKHASSSSPPSSSLDSCRTYGYIKERNGQMSSNICGTDKRESHIYTSESNSVDLLFFDGVYAMPAFLIKYEGTYLPSLLLFIICGRFCNGEIKPRVISLTYALWFHTLRMFQRDIQQGQVLGRPGLKSAPCHVFPIISLMDL